jgi:periplasmic protein CpxP/Spy
MEKRMKRVFLAASVSAAVGLAAPALYAQSTEVADSPEVVAQAAPAPAAPSAERGAPHHGPGAPGMHRRMPGERIEARLAYIRTALKITDAQQAQWDSFANVLRKHARDMDQRIQQRVAQHHQPGAQRPERPQFSAIERLERQQQRLAQRSARLNEVIAAAKPLYASFSPEQKQIADQMLAQGEHRRGPHGGGGPHRGMHRGA